MEKMEKKLNQLIEHIKPYHEKYDRYLPAVFFGLGFLLDIFTLFFKNSSTSSFKYKIYWDIS